MSEVDLAVGCWRLHHMSPVVTSASEMPAPLPTGPNTDVLLSFAVANPGFVDSEVEPGVKQLFAVRGTWYLGSIVLNDPKHDAYDTDWHRGNYWAKVFPATYDTRYSVLLFQERFALPGDPATYTGEFPVRVFTGRYLADKQHFFGHGADNWAWESFTFTLTPEDCP